MFNLGLDAESRTSGRNKIEEKLMASFIEGKGSLATYGMTLVSRIFFARGIGEIADEISLGMKDYKKEKVENECFLESDMYLFNSGN